MDGQLEALLSDVGWVPVPLNALMPPIFFALVATVSLPFRLLRLADAGGDARPCARHRVQGSRSLKLRRTNPRRARIRGKDASTRECMREEQGHESVCAREAAGGLPAPERCSLALALSLASTSSLAPAFPRCLAAAPPLSSPFQRAPRQVALGCPAWARAPHRVEGTEYRQGCSRCGSCHPC